MMSVQGRAKCQMGKTGRQLSLGENRRRVRELKAKVYHKKFGVCFVVKCYVTYIR